MEHLVDQPPSAVRVPFLLASDFLYDGGDFAGYPARCGWDFQSWLEYDALGEGIDIPLWTSRIGKASGDLPAFLQAWLFFGSLSDGLQRIVNTSDFVHYDKTLQCKILSTANLNSHLENFSDRFASGPVTEDHQLAFARCIRILQTAQKILSVLRSTIRFADPPQLDALRKVEFHCSLLVQCLVRYWSDLFYNQWNHQFDVGEVGVVPFLDELMKIDGWCPYARARASELCFDTQAVYYTVGTVRTEQDHSKCLVKYCVANQAGDDYEPKHLTLGCHCNIVDAPIDQIVEILQQGFIPLVSVKVTADSVDETIFEVKKADGNTPYIAISHVWADGLGNSVGNGIPRCQLMNLISALREIPHDGIIPFWMDTWCIPVAERWKSLRLFSIGKMHSIYKDCYGVLVLDLDLARLSVQSGYCRIISTLLMSAWMTRLWTFQEGALPPRLYLRLSNGVVETYEFLRSFREGRLVALTPALLGLYISISGAFGRLMPQINEIELDNSDLTMHNVIHSMGRRTTSRLGDEAYCIAATLDLDPTGILNINSDVPGFKAERMCKLFETMPVIPAGAIFTSGPRLRRPGFKWAPESFLTPQGQIGPPHKLHYDIGNGEVYRRPMSYLHPQGKGVVTHLHGIRVPKLDLSRTRWRVKLSDGVIFRVGN